MAATKSPNSLLEAVPVPLTTDCASDTDPLPNPPLLNERVELPGVIAEHGRKVISYFEGDGWAEEEVTDGFAYWLEEIGRGESPREAFRKTCLRRTHALPWIPRGHPNILARRLGICSGTHNLIARLAAEHGDSYTSFVRSIVETWAEQHRYHLQERPELDMGFDLEWEVGP